MINYDNWFFSLSFCNVKGVHRNVSSPVDGMYDVDDDNNQTYV